MYSNITQNDVPGAYQLRKRDKSYVDLSLSFVPSPLNNDLTVIKNERAINNAVKNIIMFMPGEVPFDRDIGSTVQQTLFDLVGESAEAVLALEIERAILYCEPRVTFDPFDPTAATSITYQTTDPYSMNFQGDELGVVVEAMEGNDLMVRVTYRIVGNEKIFYLEEILTPTR